MFTESLFHSLGAALGTDVFAAGLALGLAGASFAAVARLGRVAGRLAARGLSYTLTLDTRTDGHAALSLWLAQSGVVDHARRQMLAEVSTGLTGGTKTILVPAHGVHWFRRGAHVCLLSSQLDDKVKTGSYHGQKPLETLTVTLFGPRPRAVVQGWIAEGRRLAREEDRIGPTLYVHNQGYWDAHGALRPRSLSSMVSEDGTPERLRADLARFYASETWYADRGVPWRRGYLLTGPPGTGKSSLIRALASELGKDLASLQIGQARLSDEDLRLAMQNAPQSAIFVIEDIDAVFVGREQEQAGVSFSGLLNAIDGIAAQEGRALVMTTNHPERLDPALIRPGRADLRVEMGLIGAKGAAEMFRRFFPGEALLAERFGAAIGASRLSPAELQSWLLCHAEDAKAAATYPQPALAAE